MTHCSSAAPTRFERGYVNPAVIGPPRFNPGDPANRLSGSAVTKLRRLRERQEEFRLLLRSLGDERNRLIHERMAADADCQRLRDAGTAGRWGTASVSAVHPGAGDAVARRDAATEALRAVGRREGIILRCERGSDGTAMIADDEAYLFPLGVPGLFRSYYAPADYIETVNTIGRRLYSKQYEMPNGKGVHLDTQMNNLEICTRPGALLKVTSGAAS